MPSRLDTPLPFPPPAHGGLAGMVKVTTPPLKIQGIKTKLIPHIRAGLDWDGAGRWLEPFVGSAVVALNMAPARALLGDANPHIIRFLKAVQSGAVTAATVRVFLEREGRLLMADDRHYYRVRDRFNEGHDPHDFLFLNRACFNGVMRFNRKGEFNVPFCRKPNRFRSGHVTTICNQVRRAALGMAGKTWQFECGDWAALLDKARPGDFVYCDPPYAGLSTDYYGSWSDADALRLEARLKTLPCAFMYSMWSANKYRRNERLHRAFDAYEIRTFSHYYHVGATTDRRGGMTEALVLGKPPA